MQRLLHSFHNRLFSHQQYRQTRHEIHPPKQAARHYDWIIARSLCHYFLFALPDIPASRRDQVLHTLLRQRSPFTNYSSYVVWRQTSAQVWIWNIEKTDKSIEQNDLNQRTKVIPESLVLPLPQTYPCLRCMQCIEGVEAQYWSAEGLLVASHWWLHAPTISQWQIFLRQAHLSLSVAIPSLSTLALMPKPWAKQRAAMQWWHRLLQERILVTISALLLLAASSWEITAIWLWQQASTTQQMKIETLTMQSAPILQARNEAMAEQSIVTQLQQLQIYPSQLTLLAQVTELLAKQAVLVEWNYQLDTLLVTLEAEAETETLDPRYFIQVFQSSSWFDKVQTEPAKRSEQLVLRMQVVKL